MNSDRRGQPILGVGSLHHLPTHRARQRFLQQALALGFRAFDVAPAYGNGLNEIELGLALKGRADVRVTTKFGIPVDLYGEHHPRMAFLIRVLRRLLHRGYGSEYARRVFSATEMVASLEGSLRRLRREYVDDFLIHEPLGPFCDDLRDELNAAAANLQRQGKIRRWGVAGPATSVYPFLRDPAIEVVQAPLDDLQRLETGPRHRIAYNAYTVFRRARLASDSDFTAFVHAHLREGIDVIVATRRPETLARFKGLFA